MYWSCCTIFPPKLKERDWKFRSTKVDAGNLKHELLNRLWSILAVNVLILIFNHSFYWHVQNVTIPCRSQELLPFPSVICFFLSLFSTNHTSILPHFILPSISWSASCSCCFTIQYNTLLVILFSYILSTCPKQCNLCSLIVSVMVGFFKNCIHFFIS